MSTYDLLCLALRGDKSASAALVRIFTPIFQREAAFAVSRLRGNAEDVKQLVHDIFAELFSDGSAALKRYDPSLGASPENYFRIFARLQCMSFVRAERHALLEKLTAPLDIDSLPNEQASESAELFRIETKQTLKRLKEELDEKDFDLFNRRYLRLQSTEEICEALDITPANFFQRIHRLVKKLKDKGFCK